MGEAIAAVLSRLALADLVSVLFESRQLRSQSWFTTTAAPAAKPFLSPSQKWIATPWWPKKTLAVDQAQASGLLRPGQRMLVIQDDLQRSGWQLVSANGDTPWQATPAALDTALTFLGLGEQRI